VLDADVLRKRPKKEGTESPDGDAIELLSQSDVFIPPRPDERPSGAERAAGPRGKVG
jgi:hypothetical protein